MVKGVAAKVFMKGFTKEKVLLNTFLFSIYYCSFVCQEYSHKFPAQVFGKQNYVLNMQHFKKKLEVVIDLAAKENCSGTSHCHQLRI